MITPGYIGKNGLGKTRECDGMTPEGSFGFNAAFGIAEDPGCAIDYLQVDNSEHIIDYTREYQYCLNIDYNKEGEAGKGSAIFLHCLGAKKPYTGGCIAIPENQMKLVMQHVKPDCVAIID